MARQIRVTDMNPSPDVPFTIGVEQEAHDIDGPLNQANQDGGPPTFWETLASVPESGWEHHRLYVYRLAPKIDTGAERAYIAKYSRAIDESDLLKDHGSGRYLLLLNDTRSRRTVTKVTASVYSPDSPPRVRVEQVLDLPENTEWVAWVREGKDQKEKASAASSGAPQGADAALAKMLIEQQVQQQQRPALDPQILGLFEKANSERDALAQRLAEAGAKKPEVQPASNPVAMLRELIATTKELNPSPIPPPDPLAQLDKITSLIEKLSRAGTPPPTQKPALEQVSEMLEVLDRLRDSFPAKENPDVTKAVQEAPWFVQLAAVLSPALGPALVPIGHALAGRLVTGAGITRTSPLAPDAQAGAQQPGSTLGDAGGTSTAASATATSPEGGPDIMQLVQGALDAVNRGIDGATFAESLGITQGELRLKSIQAHGPDQIAQALSMFPQLAPVVPQLKEWIEDFCAYDSSAPEEDEEEPKPAAR